MTGTAHAAHLVVVGSGIAGLYGALLAVDAGLSVTLITKGSLRESNTHRAQGGICAVLDGDAAAPGDSVAAHIADTLKAGAGHCDPEAVRILCSEASGDIAALERYGVVFDREPGTDRRALGLEGAHSAARILHAGGDATGGVIADGLIRAVRNAVAAGTMTLLEHSFVNELCRDGDGVTGVRFTTEAGQLVELPARAVLLATGGAGQLYSHTTNPAVATADGVSLAWRAGAAVADLEFFQFHPTALKNGFLISEAVRGAGAVLRDAQGVAFMGSYHPEGDLAPRDVVSRSIASHLADGSRGETVYLDATGVEERHGPGYLKRRFPTIAATTRALGLDWTREWLPVGPAAHYWMGGVVTDHQGRTTLPNLYAAGEVAHTGVHGANRLASNSLLEGLVFGRRAVAACAAAASRMANRDVQSTPWAGPAPQGQPLTAGDLEAQGQLSEELLAHRALPQFSRRELAALMNRYAGVERDGRGLGHAAAVLAVWRAGLINRSCDAAGRESGERLNLLTVAELLVHAALKREDSLGAHQRSDFPQAPTTNAPRMLRAGHAVRTSYPTVRESETV